MPTSREKSIRTKALLDHIKLGWIRLSSSRRVTYCKCMKYALVASILALDAITIQSLPWQIRFVLGIVLALSATVIPYLRRFIVPALPIFAWLATFYACQYIPNDFRPKHIFVNVLPTLERVLYGGSLSEIISQHQHVFLDIVAWLPYGIIHFSFPFILAFMLFCLGPPGSLDIFGETFGWMNLCGVLTQLLFPNASPWYEMKYGSTPADYSVPGEAGGLARIDEILGLNIYGSSFGASPLVFGALPSLHSASATIEMLFLYYLKPNLWPIYAVYVMWMWWSTMYLTHHYLIDLVGGSIYAVAAFFVARLSLPPIDKNARSRLDYLGVTKISLGAFVHSIENRSKPITSQQDDEEEALLLQPTDDGEE